MDKETVKLRCDKCGKEFLIYKPSDMEKHTVACPSCNSKIQVVLNNVNVKLKTSRPTLKPAVRHRHIGKPMAVPGRKHLYIYKERAETGCTYTIECPECSFSETKTVDHEGNLKWTCKQCNTIIGFKAVTKKQSDHITHIFNTQRKNRYVGELTWGSIIMSKKVLLQSDSCITIGRKDDEMPSKISVNDPYMSRQSAKLETIRKDNGYTFKFTVVNASNPVFVNDTHLKPGNSIYLNYGDTIKLGKTRFTFRKSKKQ